MGTIVLVVLVVGLLIVLALAASKPKTFRIEHATSVNAPPAKIVPFIDDFHQWSLWSPFEKLDPAMQKTFGGADRGAGATYAWSGNSKAGAGRMEIVEAAPERVRIKLEFIKPFRASNMAEFTLRPSGDATAVSWAMTGPSPMPVRIMRVFMDMDAMIGRDFEQGLANLKSVAEA